MDYLNDTTLRFPEKFTRITTPDSGSVSFFRCNPYPTTKKIAINYKNICVQELTKKY